ncbi:hypothetical protein RBB50_006039 [Rhinocladiella similis]
MPQIELATLRLRPSIPTATSSFNDLWHSVLEIMTSKAGTLFQWYRSTADATVHYLLSGWRTADEHIAFLSTAQAVELAQAIGQYVSVDIVRHIEGDIDALGAARPKRLRVTLAKLHDSETREWENQWKPKEGAGSGQKCLCAKGPPSIHKNG